MQPLVSIILPTFNRGYCLGRTIQSVISQTFDNWELIIVDNHSADNTDSVVEFFDDQRIRLLKIDNHGIVAASRNKALWEAKGLYVAFLDSDDWWHPEKLQASTKELCTGAKIVYHDLYLIGSNPPRPCIWRRVKTRQIKSPAYYDLLEKGPAIANSSVVVNRNLLIQIGGFSEDPALVAAEDYDAWLRLARQTEAFVRIDKTLGYYWSGGGNISSPQKNINYLQKINQIYINNQNSNHTKPLWIIYNLAIANWALGSYKEGNRHAKEMLLNIRLSPLPFKLAIYWLITLLTKRKLDGDVL